MGRLLLVDLGEDEERFEQFMLPLASKWNHISNSTGLLNTFVLGAFDSVGVLLAQADSPLFNQAEEAQKCVIGLARDLRGLAFAFNTKQSYMMLFDWLYPDYAAVFLRALQIWYHQPQVNNLIYSYQCLLEWLSLLTGNEPGFEVVRRAGAKPQPEASV